MDVERLVTQPIAIGLLVGVLVANLVVPDHTALRRIDLEHLARAEAARAQDVLRLNVDGTHLGGEDDAVVARDVVARRTQAVAVERGAEDVAVREGDGGGAVPRLHEHRLVGVIGAALLGEVGVVVPRLRDHERHGTVERAAVHREELEHVVEDGGVGSLAVDDGQDLLEVMLQHRAVEVWLADADPGDVAAQRVDLAVVDDVAVGVRALPARRGVCRVAGVDEGERRLDGGVGEVRVEATHLRGDEHALVDDGARTHGAHVEDLVRKRRVRVGGALDGAAADVELALEVLAGGDALGATEERLEDGGHARLRRVAQVMRVDRHAAPEHERHAAFGAALLEDADRGLDGSRVGDAIGLAGLVAVREEEHRHAVITLVGEQLALLLRLLAEEAVRNLEQHARAISGVALKALAAAVLEVDEDREGVVESLVALDALQAGNGADSASVMLVAGTIQTGLAGVVLMRLHSDVLLRRSFRAVATPLADGAQASSRYSRSRICHVRYANTGATGAKQSCNTNPSACKGVSLLCRLAELTKGLSLCQPSSSSGSSSSRLSETVLSLRSMTFVRVVMMPSTVLPARSICSLALRSSA